MASSTLRTLGQNCFALLASASAYVCVGSLVAMGLGTPNAGTVALWSLAGVAGGIAIDAVIRQFIT